MSTSRPVAAGLAATDRDDGAKVSPEGAVRSDRRPQRAVPLARRYEAAFLTPSGHLDSYSRLAPALPVFERAFAAIARGTLIESDSGPVAVEDLLPGARLTTAEGRVETLTWAGSIVLYPETAESAARQLADPALASTPPRLTRITADALGLGRPPKDVVLGPHARLLHRSRRLHPLLGRDAAYLPAALLCDGISTIEVVPITPVTVHHLVLARQGTLLAGGVGIESFHPGTGFAAEASARELALFLSLFPQVEALEGFGLPAHPVLSRAEAESLLDL